MEYYLSWKTTPTSSADRLTTEGSVSASDTDPSQLQADEKGCQDATGTGNPVRRADFILTFDSYEELLLDELRRDGYIEV